MNPNETKEIVSFGSIVKTSDKNYFIAISAGEIKIESEIYYAISEATPMAKVLLNKKIDDAIEFRANKFRILEIC